jgi:hypothetical protein
MVTEFQVKRLSVILFSVLLVWMQVAPLAASATTLPCCKAATVDRCAASGCDADCCMAHPMPNSKPTPAVPAQSGIENQISLLTLTVVVWTAPLNEAPALSSTEKSPLTGASAPLYAQNCARLL